MAGQCSTCKHAYRGTYPVHASSEAHRRSAFRADHPRVKHRSKRRERADEMHRWSRMSDAAYQRLEVESMTYGKDHVRRYRRRRPLDGPRRSVRVEDYYRDHVYKRTY